jgi:hypothetical protein
LPINPRDFDDSPSSLPADVHIERAIRIEVVHQIWVVGDFSICILGLVEHRLGTSEVENSIRNHPALDEPHPPMQLDRWPICGMLFDLPAHPHEMSGADDGSWSLF